MHGMGGNWEAEQSKSLIGSAVAMQCRREEPRLVPCLIIIMDDEKFQVSSLMTNSEYRVDLEI